jgi:4-amino-4-deoxy-L-arabinose transferase-like glycosyltransferase
MALRDIAVLRLLAKPPIAIAAISFCLHLAANNQYDVFRDELYFMACGERPDFGYVDQPPLIPLIAGASHALFGTALAPLRLLPALAMAATAGLTAKFAEELGGGRFAQWLAGIAVLLAPIYLVNGLLLTTDMLQPLTWLACSWLLVRMAKTGDERLWLAFGAVVGVSFLSKYLIAFYLVGVGIGILATPLRNSLTRPWIYAGAAIALAIMAPNIAWQGAHGWPFLELAAAGANGKNLALSPLAFFGQQALMLGPASAPLWIAGLWRLATKTSQPALRLFPIAYGVMAAVFIASHGKAYYLAPIYPILFVAGAVAVEAWLPAGAMRWIAVRIIALSGLATLPIALPILPPEQFVAYARTLGLAPSAAATERGAQSVLPQYFADMFGWREMAAAVATVYQALPPDERQRAVFFGRNYGEAAALEIYGPALRGPPAISAHNNYFLWGPQGFDGSVVIMLGAEGSGLAAQYQDIQTVGRIESLYAMPYETHIPINVLRSPRAPLSEIWARLKHYD